MEVNVAAMRRRITSLPGEICSATRRALTRSAALGDKRSDRAEASRGHITESENRGAKTCPFKQRHPPLRLRKGRTNIGEPTYAPIRNPNHRAVLWT